MFDFDPDPGATLLLPEIDNASQGQVGSRDSKYKVDVSPANAMMAYQSEGGQAIIYRLIRESDGRRYALKKFKPAFRSEAVSQSCAHLSELRVLPGLEAATRVVLSPDHPIVREYEDLAWSVLMPWVSGQTCFDIFNNAQTDEKKRPDAYASVGMAQQLAGVMVGLESYKIAHTDISCGNVTIALGKQSASNGDPNGLQPNQYYNADIQLIDLEDMWRPGWGVTTHYTAGYGHPSLKCGGTTACLEGDRYATAILIAEILLLSDPERVREFSPDGYFAGDHDDAEACKRYERAQQRIKTLAPDFSDALAQAWRSRTLAECVEVASLLASLDNSRLRLHATAAHPIFTPRTPEPAQVTTTIFNSGGTVDNRNGEKSGEPGAGGTGPGGTGLQNTGYGNPAFIGSSMKVMISNFKAGWQKFVAQFQAFWASVGSKMKQNLSTPSNPAIGAQTVRPQLSLVKIECGNCKAQNIETAQYCNQCGRAL